MRRSRWTATMQDGTQKVVLAYNALDARDYYTAMGYDVARVTKGDARLQGGGFRLDRAALRDAIDLLDLKLPVRVRYSSKQGSTRGNYRFRPGRYHDIMLKSYLSPADASETLWHELTHAMQTEREGGTVEAFAAMMTRERGQYRNAPSEREARAMSATMADVPLCR